MYCMMIILIQSCDSFCGTPELGSNLYLLDKGTNSASIIYCTQKEFGCCIGGQYILPSYSRLVDKDGSYLECVVEVKYNKEWILVTTHRIQENVNNYWLIDKKLEMSFYDNMENAEIVIRDNITGPLDSLTMSDQIALKEIGLRFRRY